MFSFFRINDPYRIITVFLLVVLIRLPFYLNSEFKIIPEIGWQIVGEKLTEGAVMYTGVWEDVAPLSATIYWLLDELFGRSEAVYAAISVLLVVIQAALFNTILLRIKAYNENTYVPALVYAVLMQLFIDFTTLPPVLLCLTFVLLALNNAFMHIETRARRDEIVLNTGFYLGLATLFFLPSLTFLLALMLAFILFTGTIIRRYFLLLYGFLLPLLITAGYYYWAEALPDFYSNLLYAVFEYQGGFYFSSGSLLIVAATPLLFTVISIIRTMSMARFTNFQTRVQQVMLIMLLAALAAFFLANRKAPYQLMLFVPFAAFFITHFLLLIRKKIIAEGTFTALLVIIVLVNHGTLFQFFITERQIKIENLLAQPTPYDNLVAGKRILLLGNEPGLELYKNSKLATPYLDWRLARNHLMNLDYFDNLIGIRENMLNDLPEVIIDNAGIARELFVRIPEVGQHYRATGEAGVYLKVD